MPPAVSVVVPARDEQATVDRCVRALLALDYPRELVELVVVDDGSRDRTAEILAAYGDALTVVRQGRRGRAAARNAGVRASRNEIVAFTDADCTVEPRWLAGLVAPLADATVGIAGGRMRAQTDAGPANRYRERVHDTRAAILYWRPPYVISSNWASPRDVLEEAGLFDETLVRGSDVDLSWRIAALGYRLVYCPDAVVRFADGAGAAGLVLEGWKHGYYAVPIRRRHAAHIAAARETPPDPSAAPPKGRSLYSVSFSTGKRLGGTAGRLLNR